MADLPKDLLDQIQKLEDIFIVDGNKLKEITTQFVSELERGLSQEDATIVRTRAELQHRFARADLKSP